RFAAVAVIAGHWAGESGRLVVGCPLPKPASAWNPSPSLSLAPGPRPEGSRIVAMSTPVSFSLRPGPRGQPAFPARTRIWEASWMEQPQEVEDEAYERVWERVAAIDVAKASGVVCTRVPGDGPSGR